MTDLAMNAGQDRAEHAMRETAVRLPARQLSTPALVALGFLLGVGLVGSIAAFAAFKGMALAHFTRDPVSVMGGAAYIGFLSNVGIVLWISAAAAALTASLFAEHLGQRTNARNFLLGTGLITLLLGLDDLFMLHEDVLPRLGVPQAAIQVGYVGLGMIYALMLHKEILARRVTLFLLAGIFLGGSLAVDALFPPSDSTTAVEDIAKLFGIVFWFLFVISSVVGLQRNKSLAT